MSFHQKRYSIKKITLSQFVTPLSSIKYITFPVTFNQKYYLPCHIQSHMLLFLLYSTAEIITNNTEVLFPVILCDSSDLSCYLNDSSDLPCCIQSQKKLQLWHWITKVISMVTVIETQLQTSTFPVIFSHRLMSPFHQLVWERMSSSCPICWKKKPCPVRARSATLTLPSNMWCVVFLPFNPNHYKMCSQLLTSGHSTLKKTWLLQWSH